MIENWNATVKHDEDIVYHLGDVYMGNSGRVLHRLRGRKRLILGNHDNGKDQHLLNHFQKILVWRMFPEFGLLLTHVPVHPETLNPNKCPRNIHGHIHERRVKPLWGDKELDQEDDRYINVCVEHTNYAPVNIEELRVK